MSRETFRYRIQGVARAPRDPRDPVGIALAEYRIPSSEVVRSEVLRESLDARRANRPVYRYVLEIETSRPFRRHGMEPLGPAPADPEQLALDTVSVAREIHVVGSGPCGIACAIALAEKGFRVVLHERGADITERSRLARHLVKQGVLDPETNFLFGEGGAGTFTDGKLTTRSRGLHVRQALAQWVACGEEPSIQWRAKPHLGTDRMRVLVAEMRRRFVQAGGEMRFQSRLDDIDIGQGAIRRARFGAEWVSCEALVLAIGHSARDTLRMLHAHGLPLEFKDFAMGARIEHPQELINRRQYGARVDPKLIGAAEYALSCSTGDEERPGAYTFCMCPGGEILPTSTSAEELATNGMSFRARAGRFANAGLVAPVREAQLRRWCAENGEPWDSFAGIRLQERVERAAAAMGSSPYQAPAQRAADFLAGRASSHLPVATSYPLGLAPENLADLFPAFITESMALALGDFDRKIPGFVDQGLLIAPETRTSSPLRIDRDDATMESTGIQGIYPLGEGAGWSGGIVTSAADGLRFAHRARRENSIALSRSRR